ncbi:tetratricopeptide repeat protein [Azospirillum sp. sgz302134]
MSSYVTVWRKDADARRRLLGAEHPDTLTSMNNLATALRSQGDLVGARELQEQVLAGRHRLLGAEHPSTLTSMNNLASILWGQGDLYPSGAPHLADLALSGASAKLRRPLGGRRPRIVLTPGGAVGAPR